MQKKDYMITVLAPVPVLTIPLVGMMLSPQWQWTWADFVLAWVILAVTTFLYRLLATRRWSNLPYRAGAGLAIAAGFLITWISLAVRIIGDENPGNLLYLLVLGGGLIGAGLSRFEPSNLAKVAFAMAGALLILPTAAFRFWPADFNPGYAEVQILSSAFAAMFAGSGLLFRRAARPPAAG